MRRPAAGQPSRTSAPSSRSARAPRAAKAASRPGASACDRRCPATCAGYTGSYGFERQDARQYAAWGFDYLKYDWCSYGGVADRLRKGPNPPGPLDVYADPYRQMHAALAGQNRDVVFSLCQYGMGDVWQWGASAGGNCWRTTDDIDDTWGSMSGIGFHQGGTAAAAGPGHWNDPDMLVVGQVGWGPKLRPTRLTPNEQCTHVSLWSLLSAPLLIGCDMTRLDDFTRGLLTNDDVIAVDQDPLGRQATRAVVNDDDTEIWAKDLADGGKAVGLFNRSEVPVAVTVRGTAIGRTGLQSVRDLWRQTTVADHADAYTATVGRHGVVLLKFTPAATP